MLSSTTRTVTRIRYAATLLSALAVVGLVPVTAAAATDNDAAGGCRYTNATGNSVSIGDDRDVVMDGKIVSCRSGQITVTAVPKRATELEEPPA